MVSSTWVHTQGNSNIGKAHRHEITKTDIDTVAVSQTQNMDVGRSTMGHYRLRIPLQW
jgi:hypothetical protein